MCVCVCVIVIVIIIIILLSYFLLWYLGMFTFSTVAITLAVNLYLLLQKFVHESYSDVDVLYCSYNVKCILLINKNLMTWFFIV